MLSGDLGAGISKLKKEIEGDIVVYASYQLVRTLLDHDLVDELRLIVFPVVLGDGIRLFGPTSDKVALHLAEMRAIGNELTFLNYQVVR